MSERLCRNLRIHGVVQGVGFRYAFHREALSLGVSGWVRNRRDGTVEAVVEGSSEAVAAIVAWAHRGPSASEVARVDVTAASGTYSGFDLLPTA
jgi:acylphosphatase